MIPPFASVIFDPVLRPSSLQLEINGYHLTEVVGHGSASTVYIGLKGNRTYCIKEMIADRYSQDQIRGIVSSLQRLAMLSNRHLAPLLDWHRTGNSIFLVSSVAPGISAESNYLAPLGWSLALNVGKKIAQSLAYAWNFQGMAHGNIKPSNVFIDSNAGELNNVTVTDFGIPGSSESESLAIFAATKAFQAPEWTGLGPPDFKGDFYSLGALIFYLACGRVPTGNLLNDPGLSKEIPVDVLQIIRLFMRPQSNERPNNWAEVLEVLNRVSQVDPFEHVSVGVGGDFLRDSWLSSADLGNKVVPQGVVANAHNAVLNAQLTASIDAYGLDYDGIERGTIVAGNYRVVHCLSREINFSLYEVEDIVLAGRVFLKILSSQGMNYPLVRQRLHVEWTLLASLDYRYYPVAVGKGTWNSREYFLTKRPLGHPISAYLLKDSVIHEGQALWIVNQLAVALNSGFESAQLIHRDICPDHLMVVDGQVPHLMITDCSLAYGRAPLDTEDFAQREKLPTIGVGSHLSVGTPAYMAPEQIHGDVPSISMDIYAIGCLLFRLIAGRTPFVANNAKKMLHAQLYERPPFLNQFSRVTDATNKLVKDCLAKNPNQRPRDYQELIGELNKCAFSLDLESKRQITGKTTKRHQTHSTARARRL